SDGSRRSAFCFRSVTRRAGIHRMVLHPLEVYLDDLAAPVIVVAAPTGVTYRNQVNGIDCEQRSLEGLLLPASGIVGKVFDPGWWHEHLSRRGVESWAFIYDQIEEAFSAAPHSNIRNLRVDR